MTTQPISTGSLVFTVDAEGPPDGTPVILLHGYPNSRHSWGALLEPLPTATTDPDAPCVEGTWYPDNDEDGFAPDGSEAQEGCRPTDGAWTTELGDCDDSNDLISPDTSFDFGDRQDNDCDGSVDEDVGSERYSHDADIQSIWNAECGAACHLGSSSSGGISLQDGYTSMVGVASKDIPSMALVEPGDLDGSYLWLKLNNTHLSAGGSGGIMPKSGALPSSDLAIIETWILEGAVE